MRQLYAATDLSQQTARSIIIGTQKDMLSALIPADKGGKKSLYYALQGRSYAGAHLHFVSAAGTTRELQLMTTYTMPEIVSYAFSHEEIAAANTSSAEASINGLDCYEFLSGDLSKLMWIKRAYSDVSRVGIACWPHQVDFIRAVLGQDVKLRSRYR